MRRIIWVVLLFLLAGCSKEEVSWIAIKNDTSKSIYVLPYSSEYADGEWIQPGMFNEFYSIESDYLDVFAYFTLYYDSLVIHLEGLEEAPIKFYQDGRTVNYDAKMNPFTNPDVWQIQDFKQKVPGNNLNAVEEIHVQEFFFSVDSCYLPICIWDGGTESDAAL